MEPDTKPRGDYMDADELSQDDMLRAIGVDPSVIRWPDPVRAADPNPDFEDVSPDSALGSLTDSEWQLIAQHLPAEARQANTMCNRDFVDAVLAAMIRGRWTDHRNRGSQSDAVRRRFGRWASQGIWQQLVVVISALPISAARKAAFATIGRRSYLLFRSGGGRPSVSTRR
jgi:transposase